MTGDDGPRLGNIMISVVRLLLLPLLTYVDPEKPQMLHVELGEGAALVANIMLLHDNLTNFGFVEVVF